MRVRRSIIIALLIAVVPLNAQAQDAKPRRRVLILGDSTYSHHTRELSNVLKDKVEVVYAFWNPDEIADTAEPLEGLWPAPEVCAEAHHLCEPAGDQSGFRVVAISGSTRQAHLP